jgi:hypothetical protein
MMTIPKIYLPSLRLRNSQPTRTALRGVPLILLVFTCVQGCFGITSSQYHERLKTALRSLQAVHADADQLSSDDAAKLHTAREALPRNEVVEWLGTRYLIDNGWLDDQLKDVERSDTTAAARYASLKRVTERLEALDARLNEDEAAGSKYAGKAETHDRLAAILQRPEYAKAVKEETAFSRILRWLSKFIERLFPSRKSMSPSRATALSRFAQIFVVVIALAAIGYSLWMFAPRLLQRRKSKKPAKQTARVVLGERLEPEQSAADLIAEAEALARNGDLRGAIRRGYIALLVELADRNLISLAQYKTNRDYLRALRSSAPLHRQMESLTNNFELHWYGLVPPQESDWTAFRTGYKEALTST